MSEKRLIEISGCGVCPGRLISPSGQSAFCTLKGWNYRNREVGFPSWCPLKVAPTKRELKVYENQRRRDREVFRNQWREIRRLRTVIYRIEREAKRA